MSAPDYALTVDGRRLTDTERQRLLIAMETEECEALNAMVPESIRARAETDQHRWPSMAVLSVLAAFERMGASGFSVERTADGVRFAPVGAPKYLERGVA